MKRRCCSRLVLLIGVLSVTLAIARGQTNIVPDEAEVVFGNSFADPFFFGLGYVEQIYAASEFPVDVFVITEIAFRIDGRSEEPLDAVIPSITLRMNVFPGSMEEVVLRESGVVDPQITVFFEEDVHLTAREGSPNAFDVRFKLDPPFVYDRRAGHLCLTLTANGENSGRARAMDAQGIYAVPGDPSTGISFKRGAYIYLEPFGYRRVSARIIVTQFRYRATAAKIDAVRRVESAIQLDFTVIGEAGNIQVVGASDVSGPYAIESNAEVTAISQGKWRSVIPLSNASRYFQIRLE